MRKLYHLLFICFLWVQTATTLMAQGGLLVSPQRIVFEGRERSTTVTLFNRSNQTNTYRVFFNEKTMTAEGLLKDLKDDNPHAASSLVRYSPRRVTLKAGESQKVRLLLRRPADLEEGEYRSHLVFQYVPPEGGLQLDDLNRPDKALGIKLTPLFGASIPIIVRHGHLQTTVSIDQGSLITDPEGRPNALRLEFQRIGNRSAYGDLIAQLHLPGREPTRVGRIRGMAIYTELKQRAIDLPLNLPNDLTLDGGTIRFTYSDPQNQGKVWVQKDFSLN